MHIYNCAGVILSAGESSRMGCDKATLLWHGHTLLEAHLEALRPYADCVLVVAGKNRARLQPLVEAHAAYLLENEEPERGQFSSLQTGLREVANRGRDVAIISPVDHPPAFSETIARLGCAFQRAPTSVWMVVPEHKGKHGHPIVVGPQMISAFLSAVPSSNARVVKRANEEHVLYLPVDDPFTVANLNTHEDYSRITKSSQHGWRNTRIDAKMT
jgi:molybdenum cofactor cytidylyltransferase